MKKKLSIFEMLVIYFPVAVLLFQGLKTAYEKYLEIKEQNQSKTTLVNESEPA